MRMITILRRTWIYIGRVLLKEIYKYLENSYQLPFTIITNRYIEVDIWYKFVYKRIISFSKYANYDIEKSEYNDAIQNMPVFQRCLPNALVL